MTLNISLEVGEIHRQRARRKNKIGRKNSIFCPCSIKNRKTKNALASIFVFVVTVNVCSVSPSLVQGVVAVVYRHLQCPRPVARRYPRVLHVEVVVAKCAECVGVNLEEALPHPL